MEKMTAEYKGNLACELRMPKSENVVYTDASPEKADTGTAFSPGDLLASALAACTLSMMGHIMGRGGVDLQGTKIEYYKEMTDVPVHRVGKIFLQITVRSDRPLSEVERAKLEAAARACAVRQSIHPDIEVGETFEYL